MSDAHKLPLFAWHPPRKVLLLPLTRRIGKVRHTAELMSRKHGEDGDLYSKQVLAGLRRHFDRLGVPAEEADPQIVAFFEAVQDEMNRIAFEGPHSGQRPGGDRA